MAIDCLYFALWQNEIIGSVITFFTLIGPIIGPIKNDLLTQMNSGYEVGGVMGWGEIFGLAKSQFHQSNNPGFYKVLCRDFWSPGPESCLGTNINNSATEQAQLLGP